MRRKRDHGEAPTLTSAERGQAHDDFYDDIRNRLEARIPALNSSRRRNGKDWRIFHRDRIFAFEGDFHQGNLFRVMLNIRGPKREANKQAFDLLLQEKEQIERLVGSALEWKPGTKTGYSIYAVREGVSINSSPETLAELRDWAVEHLVRFLETFGPKIKA